MNLQKKLIAISFILLAVTTSAFGSPSTRYQEYLGLMVSNAGVETVSPYMNKKMREKLKETPKALMRLQHMVKYKVGAGSTISGETVDGDTAVVKMSPVKEKSGKMTYIKIEMIKEDGQWVIHKPTYSNTPQ